MYILLKNEIFILNVLLIYDLKCLLKIIFYLNFKLNGVDFFEMFMSILMFYSFKEVIRLEEIGDIVYIRFF